MSKYVRNKPRPEGWPEKKTRESIAETCALCGNGAERVLVVLEEVDGRVWPPFPICLGCYHQYEQAPSRKAADYMVRRMAREMLARAEGGRGGGREETPVAR